MVDVSGLNLGLHEEVKGPLELFGNEAEVPDLGLVDYGLFPLGQSAPVRLDVNTVNGEEAAGLVADAAILEVPGTQLSKRHLPYAYTHRAFSLIQPIENLAGRHVSPFMSERAFQELKI